MKNHSLTEGSIAKGLLFFVIPLFFSNLFQQLYNTIDTLLVGHFLGDNALAAMGATAAIFELIVQFSNGCGTGFSIVTARYFGSKNEDENNPFISYFKYDNNEVDIKGNFKCSFESKDGGKGNVAFNAISGISMKYNS